MTAENDDDSTGRAAAQARFNEAAADDRGKLAVAGGRAELVGRASMRPRPMTAENPQRLADLVAAEALQ